MVSIFLVAAALQENGRCSKTLAYSSNILCEKVLTHTSFQKKIAYSCLTHRGDLVTEIL